MNRNSKNGDQKRTKANVIQALRIHGPVARIDLAQLTRLSRATISFVISELIEGNLVQETNSKYSTGGRPATLIELTSNSNYILGAEFSNHTLTLGAFDLIGNVVKETVLPIKNHSPEGVIKTLAENLDDFVNTMDIKPINLIGLGMPGLIDVNRGIIRSASDVGWFNVDITKMIKEEMAWPTVVLNRYRARGLAECRFGSGKDFNEVIYIGIGTGIAAGLFNQRQLLLGAIGGAGEAGHITIEPDGPLCPCGNRGCLQQLATGPAMEQETRMLLRSGKTSAIYPDSNYDLQLITAETICRGADNQDELCMQVVEKAASYLGIAMANLVNIMNPEAIILGGSVPASCDYYVKTASQVMRQRAMSSLSAGVVVNKASDNKLGGALGAANFALDQNIEYSLFNSIPGD